MSCNSSSRSKKKSYLATSQANLSHTVFTWKIDKFSYRNQKIWSPFFADELKNRFQLKLFTRRDTFNDYPELSFEYVRKYVSVDLKLVSANCIEVKYKFSLLDAQGKARFYDEGFCDLVYMYTKSQKCTSGTLNDEVSPKITFHKIAKLADVLNPEKGYLLDDTLTLHVEIFQLKNENNKLLTLESEPSERIMKTLREDYGSFLKRGNLADVKLIVGGKIIPAHKSFLSARSPVFAAMFAHETKEQQDGQVEIPDVSLDAFETLLEFLYTGAMPTLDNIKSAEDLIIVADKYDCGQLKTVCEEYLISQVTIETAPTLLLLANLVSADKLKGSSLEFIRCRGSELFDALKSNPEQMINLFQILAEKSESKSKEEKTSQPEESESMNGTEDDDSAKGEKRKLLED